MTKIKILFVAMPSIHFIRWIENLDTQKYELYWFDILNRHDLNTNISIYKITNWNKKFPIKGYTFLKKHFPFLHKKVENILYNDVENSFEKWLLKINPDIVHSFEMQSCSYPILSVLNKYKEVKWLYSCWGSDIFYYQNFDKHIAKIKNVLERIDYLHTDCERDYILAKKHGFKGEFKGIIPGGGGYNLDTYKKYKTPIANREIILVKGYQNNFGRAISVIQALQNLQLDNRFKIVVFAADYDVAQYCKQHNLPWKIFKKSALTNNQVLELMGKSYIYIGNNISDGIPNTLLESMVMGAIPIQSNPGKATSEFIVHGENGFLIDDSDNVLHIQNIIMQALEPNFSLEKALTINENYALNNLDYFSLNKKINGLYLINQKK